MKRNIKKFVASIGLIVSVFAVLFSLSAVPVSAVNVFENSCGGGASVDGQSSGGSTICGAKGDDVSTVVQNVVNTMLLIVGMIAVIMIIIGGIRYVTSNGDPQQTKSAKDTVLYAVIGIIVAIMAYAIVGFVIARFK